MNDIFDLSTFALLRRKVLIFEKKNKLIYRNKIFVDKNSNGVAQSQMNFVNSGRNFTFDGDVSMQVTVVASTSVFVVNANRLNFSSITVTDGNGNNLNVASTS